MFCLCSYAVKTCSEALRTEQWHEAFYHHHCIMMKKEKQLLCTRRDILLPFLVFCILFSREKCFMYFKFVAMKIHDSNAFVRLQLLTKFFRRFPIEMLNILSVKNDFVNQFRSTMLACCSALKYLRCLFINEPRVN